jgi:hypothetical protein
MRLARQLSSRPLGGYVQTGEVLLVKLAITLLLTALLASCRSTLDPLGLGVGDGGFLSSRPCGPPCLWNITPGESDRIQAEDEIRARGVFENCEFDSPADSDFEWISCGFALSVIIQKSDSLVYSLSFEPSRTIRVRDAIRILGAPSCVSVGLPLLPDNPATDAALFFVDPRVVLLLESQRNFFAYSLRPRSQVIYIGYGPASGGSFPDHCADWRGYGDYPTPPWP